MSASSTDPLPTAEAVSRIVRDAAASVLDTWHPALADEPDGVHRHRTAVRRLRSILAAFRRMLAEPAAESVRVAYKEWGTQLGVVRDAEVRADIADAALADAGIDDAAARRRLVEEERSAYSRAHARLVTLAGSPRAIERERMLRALAAAPIAEGLDGRARKDLRRVLRTEAKRVRKAADELDASLDARHDLRKAGRRLRYVADAVEVAEPELKRVGPLAKAGKRIHSLLGDERDALLFVERIAHTRMLATRAGESGAPYERMLANAGDPRVSPAELDDAVDAVAARAARI